MDTGESPGNGVSFVMVVITTVRGLRHLSMLFIVWRSDMTDSLYFLDKYGDWRLNTKTVHVTRRRPDTDRRTTDTNPVVITGNDHCLETRRSKKTGVEVSILGPVRDKEWFVDVLKISRVFKIRTCH